MIELHIHIHIHIHIRMVYPSYFILYSLMLTSQCIMKYPILISIIGTVTTTDTKITNSENYMFKWENTATVVQH